MAKKYKKLVTWMTRVLDVLGHSTGCIPISSGIAQLSTTTPRDKVIHHILLSIGALQKLRKALLHLGRQLNFS